MPELIRPVELARLKGVSQVAVHHAMKSRIAAAIVEVDGKRMLDRDQALLLWEKNTKRTRHPNSLKAAQKLAAEGRKPPEVKGAEIPSPEDVAAGADHVPDLNTSRAQHEYWKAVKAQLEAKEKRGELMEIKRHHQVMFERARATRDMLQAIPARIVDELAVIADVVDPAKRFAMQEMMDREINHQLTGLADLADGGKLDG